MDERSTVMVSYSRRCRDATSINDRKCRSRLMRRKATGKDCHGLPRSMKSDQAMQPMKEVKTHAGQPLWMSLGSTTRFNNDVRRVGFLLLI